MLAGCGGGWLAGVGMCWLFGRDGLPGHCMSPTMSRATTGWLAGWLQAIHM